MTQLVLLDFYGPVTMKMRKIAPAKLQMGQNTAFYFISSIIPCFYAKYGHEKNFFLDLARELKLVISARVK